MKIYIGADHAGFAHKAHISDSLRDSGLNVIDCGNTVYDENDDYPDFVVKVAREVSLSPQDSVGIVIGGSGQGEAMVANRFRHVRAAVFYHPKQTITSGESMISLVREHNDANVLSLGARFLSQEEAVAAVRTFLDTAFSEEERHRRRISKMDKIHE